MTLAPIGSGLLFQASTASAFVWLLGPTAPHLQETNQPHRLLCFTVCASRCPQNGQCTIGGISGFDLR